MSHHLRKDGTLPEWLGYRASLANLDMDVLNGILDHRVAGNLSSNHQAIEDGHSASEQGSQGSGKLYDRRLPQHRTYHGHTEDKSIKELTESCILVKLPYSNEQGCAKDQQREIDWSFKNIPLSSTKSVSQGKA